MTTTCALFHAVDTVFQKIRGICISPGNIALIFTHHTIKILPFVLLNLRLKSKVFPLDV